MQERSRMMWFCCADGHTWDKKVKFSLQLSKAVVFTWHLYWHYSGCVFTSYDSGSLNMLAFRQRFSFANCLFSVFCAWNECKEFLEGENACCSWVCECITLSGRELIWVLFWNSKLVGGERRKICFSPCSPPPSFLTSVYTLDFQPFWFWVFLLLCFSFSLLLFCFRNSFFPNIFFLLCHLTKLIVVRWSMQGLPNFCCSAESSLCCFTTKGRKRIVN